MLYVPADKKSVIALVTNLLLSYPAAGVSEKSAEARGQAYWTALNDIPLWALDEAIKSWHRGEVGELPDIWKGSVNFQWAPPPAILRAICLKIMKPYKRIEQKLLDTLEAVSLSDALEDDKIIPLRRGMP